MTIVTRIEAGEGAGGGGGAGSGQAWLHLGAAVEPVWRVPAALPSRFRVFFYIFFFLHK